MNQMEPVQHTRPVNVSIDSISAAYKATALKAAEEMPADGTIKELTRFVIDQLIAAHPEISWGVELIKFIPGKLTDMAYMLKSDNSS